MSLRAGHLRCVHATIRSATSVSIAASWLLGPLGEDTFAISGRPDVQAAAQAAAVRHAVLGADEDRRFAAAPPHPDDGYAPCATGYRGTNPPAPAPRRILSIELAPSRELGDELEATTRGPPDAPAQGQRVAAGDPAKVSVVASLHGLPERPRRRAVQAVSTRDQVTRSRRGVGELGDVADGSYDQLPMATRPASGCTLMSGRFGSQFMMVGSTGCRGRHRVAATFASRPRSMSVTSRGGRWGELRLRAALRRAARRCRERFTLDGATVVDVEPPRPASAAGAPHLLDPDRAHAVVHVPHRPVCQRRQRAQLAQRRPWARRHCRVCWSPCRAAIRSAACRSCSAGTERSNLYPLRRRRARLGVAAPGAARPPQPPAFVVSAAAVDADHVSTIALHLRTTPGGWPSGTSLVGDALPDGGATVPTTTLEAHSDAHQLLTHPLAGTRGYEAAGQGIAGSEDRGRQLGVRFEQRLDRR